MKAGARWRQDPNWTPNYSHKGVSLKVPAEEEQQVAKILKRDYIDAHRLCTKTTVRHIMKREIHRDNDEEINFGDKYISNFLDRQQLSVRSPHVKRRSVPNDEKVCQFLQDMDAVACQFTPDYVINVDETSWKLINGRLRTIARRGAEDVVLHTGADPRADITAIAACCKSGEKLPLWVLATGKTAKCTEKFTKSPVLRHYITSKLLIVHYSVKGWATSSVMIEYLKWLKRYKKDHFCNVLWDVHASHRHKDVIEWASRNDVGLTFIPAGQTDVWQPLDKKIFGSLKKRSMLMMSEDMITERLEQHDLHHAISILVRAWGRITEEEVRKAWEHLDD